MENKKRYIIGAICLVSIITVICLSVIPRHKTSSHIQNKATVVRHDSTVLNVALMPTFACLPFYYAYYSGIYDSLGLKTAISTFQSQMDVDTALQNKGTDVAYTDLIRASRLQSRHVQLQAIMQCEENWKLITAREKRVKQIGQLKEKMIAIARFSATDYITNFVVHKARIKVDEIYKPQINSLPIRLSMLCNNQLDAAILPEPYASYSVKMGHRLVYAQDSMQVQLSAIVAKESALKNTLKCKNIALLIKGYNIAVDKLAHYKILGQLGKTSKIFSLPAESIGDSIFIPHYKKAKAVSSRDVAVSLNFLNERKQLSRKNAGKSLISYKFIRP